jgi:hypothetical protein
VVDFDRTRVVRIMNSLLTLSESHKSRKVDIVGRDRMVVGFTTTYAISEGSL